MHDALKDHLHQQGLANNTIRIYLAAWRRWEDHTQQPDRLDTTELRAWSDTLPKSHGTRSHARSTIKHAAHVLGVPGTPWEAVRVPAPPRRRSRAVTHLQAQELVRTAMHHGGREGTATLCAMFTAARRSEVAQMRWDGVDFEAGTIKFWRPKNRDWHTVPLHPVLGEWLAERQLPGETWVFPGRNGGHITPSLVASWIKEVAALAGIPRFTSHLCRHTALTEAYDGTGDLRAAQELAGHASPVHTAMYSRVSAQRLMDAVAALDWNAA